MKSNPKGLLLLFFLALGISAFSQKENFRYKKEILGIRDQWHKIILPDEIFHKINADFSDIRILGIDQQNDTIEVPYILTDPDKPEDLVKIPFRLLNESSNERGYYFTFDAGETREVNEIELTFKQTNFDWKINLEGSQDLTEWFSIADDYRILAIQNAQTNFQFAKLVFPVAKFRYFRMLIKAAKKPVLEVARITLRQGSEGVLKDVALASQTIEEERNLKQTLINVTLNEKVPVAFLKIWVADRIDYYRPVSVLYADDSVRNNNRWRFYYGDLASGILQSSTPNEFKFRSTILQKLKIVIQNGDNRPLKIDSLKIRGYQYELKARFIEPAKYFLLYGNQAASKPDYDIARFEKNIPALMSTLSLGKEEMIASNGASKTSPLFKNKAWLWLIMIVIIGILGWFSISMIKKRN